MRYTIKTAHLIAATYGPAFTPASSAPPHILAMNFDGARDLQTGMDGVCGSWRSDDFPDQSQAMLAARTALGNALGESLGAPCSIDSTDADYYPVYDKAGNLIGHTTVGWMISGGQPVIKEMPDGQGNTIGLVACVLVSIGPA